MEHIKYQKGSEWRKWDLHFHTPSSYDYKDKSISNKDIIDTLKNNQIEVVAITDHHIIDVDRINELQDLANSEGITVLPGIEFLSDARGSEPVHFIAIFSETCDLNHIWGKLKYNTSLSRIDSEGKKVNEIYCDLRDTIELIHKLGGVVSIHSGKKHGSIETITNSLAHTVAQKEDIADNVDIYELGKTSDQSDYNIIVFPAIGKVLPMIICSDNHDIKNYVFKDSCWFKADPNFDGLLQVINEPEERVFIGEIPPLLSKVNSNKTKYIKEIAINQVAGYDETQGIWFKDISIPLNSELVAIIGNKGSGKSALADIISLCSNYYDDKDFSFLTSKKFKSKSGKIAKNFFAEVNWHSEIKRGKNLYDTPDPADIHDVKYLPQGQFERLTNEISTAKEFQTEIESVVFSHIPDSERLGTGSFQDLIEKKTSSVENELTTLNNEITTVNKSIIDLERKSTDEYRIEIERKIAKKQEEYDALTPPPPVTDPNDDPKRKEQSEEINKKVEAVKVEIQNLQTQISDSEKNKKKLFEDIQQLNNVKTDIEQKKIELERFISTKSDELSSFEIEIGKLISFSVDFTELEDLISEKKKELEIEQLKLGEIDSVDESISLADQLSAKEKELKSTSEKLDADQKAYQDYLTAHSNWKNEQEKIKGSSETLDSLEYYRNILSYINEKLSDDLRKKFQERSSYVRRIFDKKQEIISIYKDARTQLNHIIEKHSDTLKDYSVSVEASLVKKADFIPTFLNQILKNMAGSFYSSSGGELKIKQISDEIDFDDFDSVMGMLEKIQNALQYDERDGQNNAKRKIVDQVKDLQELYDYLYSLKFLEKNYQLKQGDKDIEQLSPGERGALLLVFYLLLDKNDVPLIIDQPEDNLDNNSVATVLVPFIREAKKKRQIIMVTHNPNLAVVSDAEQIIFVDIDKRNDYKFSTITGSIENKLVNQKIVDVLEGAMPAFKTRKQKYYDDTES